MSGPYDHQQVAGQFTGQTAAAGNRQRTQRAGDSSTSLSSASSANVYKANAAGAAHQQYATVGAVQGAGAAQGAGGYGQFLQGSAGYGQFVQGAGGSGQFGGSVATVATGPRRQGRFHRETYRLPDPGVGHVRQVRRRLATPEPDTIERVYLQRAANEIIEEITEVPTTPPPRIQERTIVEPAGPPQVIKRVIRVPPRSGGYYQGQQSVGAAGGNFQASGHLLSAGSYGNVQQAGVAHQQSYGGAAGLSGGYGSFGGAAGFAGGQQQQQQQQQGFGFGGFSSQGFQQSPIGLPGAFCFQV